MRSHPDERDDTSIMAGMAIAFAFIFAGDAISAYVTMHDIHPAVWILCAVLSIGAAYLSYRDDVAEFEEAPS